MSLETDPVDGHPTAISVDHIENAIDDESCYGDHRLPTGGLTPGASSAYHAAGREEHGRRCPPVNPAAPSG